MDVWLKYSRVGETYDAVFSLGEDGTEWGLLRGATWNSVLRTLASNLRDLPSAGLVLLRTDHPFAEPARISDDQTNMFREDPVQAIGQWTQEVQGGGGPQRMSIPAGHSVLADSFGERLYLSKDEVTGNVESPVHGDMVPVTDADWGNTLPLRSEAPGWYTCSTLDLIRVGVPRLFLPRSWNPGLWIQTEQLQSLLDSFLLRKAQAECLSLSPPPR
jgi:hypothetical protein